MRYFRQDTGKHPGYPGQSACDLSRNSRQPDGLLRNVQSIKGRESHHIYGDVRNALIILKDSVRSGENGLKTGRESEETGFRARRNRQPVKKRERQKSLSTKNRTEKQHKKQNRKQRKKLNRKQHKKQTQKTADDTGRRDPGGLRTERRPKKRMNLKDSSVSDLLLFYHSSFARMSS